ncbi:MAG TPA: beta-propeller fold lactonase family protein [Solirubrobacteraceae bacterium]|jgi:6-phosphogluconolactonase (cycloisomerase 2 family)
MVGLVVGVCWLGFAAAADAGITPVPGSPFATGDIPSIESLAFSPSGGLLAVPNQNGKTVSVLSVNQSTGALTPVSGSPFANGGAEPESVAFSPDGRFLATANIIAGTVSVFSINPSTGALVDVGASPFPAAGHPYSLVFSPVGGLLAAANLQDNTVSVFSVDQTTGALTLVSGSPFATGAQPDGVAFSPDGGLLAVTNGPDNTVSVFSVNQSTGALTQVSGSPFATGGFPESVAFNRRGGLLATGNTVNGGTDGTVSVFSVNESTGALTQVSGSPFATGPSSGISSVAFSRDGGRLAAANYQASTVSLFSVNQGTGALTAVSGSPFASGGNPAFPVLVAFSPHGRFLATANEGGTVSMFSVDVGGGFGPSATSVGLPSSSLDPSVAGQAVTFTVNVSPVPDGGTVQFTDPGTTIPGCGAVPVDTSNGQASCTTTFSTPGSYGVQAVYSGDGFFASSQSSVLTHTVASPPPPQPTPTLLRLSSSTNPVFVRRQVTYTAHVTPVPDGGHVTFFDNGHVIPGCANLPVIATGTATCKWAYSWAAARTIKARYTGTPRFANSAANKLIETVKRRPHHTH